MSKVFFRSLLVSPVVLGVALANTASAQDATQADALSQINQYASEGASLSQVRSVNQLSDVKPTDWAYQALRSLVERYGCIAGYPDSTFRGNRAMTRYEFAAGLNACLDTVNELIASATADLATQEDLLVLQRLQEEFQAELATLRGRVDALEARTSELESNQFSTTTKLAGEAIFGLQDEFNTPDGPGVADINTTFGSRVRLDLTSSFTGTDRLRTRLEAENIPGFAGVAGSGGDSSTYSPGKIEYEGTGLDFNLDQLYYSFKPSKKSFVVAGPVGVTSMLFAPGTGWQGRNFTSDFLDAPTFYEQDADEAGIGGNYQFNKYINLAAGYVSNSATDETLNDASSPGDGLFISNWAASTQLTGTVGKKFQGALAFVHEYKEGVGSGSSTGAFGFNDGVGTDAARSPFGTVPVTAETLGLSMRYNFSSRFILMAYGSHSWADAKASVGTDADPSAKSFSAGLGFVFPDLFREGNEGGIAVGVPPHVYDNSGTGAEDSDTPFAIDLYYNFAITDNISIRPGGIILFNGNGGNNIGGTNATNGSVNDDTVFVGALKTTFKF